MKRQPVPAAPTPVDSAALDDALAAAANRFGRLSDEQVRALRRRRRTMAAVPAALSAIGLAVLVPSLLPRDPAAPPGRLFVTRPGAGGTVRLADGSTVRLNGATRIRVTYSDRARAVELLEGQAFFDVRHDAARPFTVHATVGEARVLGTAFDVDLTGQQLVLAVYRGAVGLDAAGTRRGVVVRAGYRSRVSGRTVQAPSSFDPALPDWRSGWIDTDGMRLDELVELLRRRGATAIEQPRGALAAIRIAGRFRVDRPTALLRAIGAGFGFTVAEQNGTLVLKPT